VDDCGYLFRPQPGNPLATVSYNDRVRVKRLAEQFTEIWEAATPDRELARLHL
jgi:hypothetical protein